MPRKSVEALSVVSPVNVKLARVEAPDYLSDAEQQVFGEIVKACEAHHFTAADVPLLVEYSRAVALGKLADGQIKDGGAVVEGKLSPWVIVQEKAQRALVALAARLRICPQSRFDRMTAGARSRPLDDDKPWQQAAAH